MKKYKDGSPKKHTKCICPCCTTKHTKFLHWIGTIPARKYCRQCQKAIDEDMGITPISIFISGRDVEYYIEKKERS